MTTNKKKNSLLDQIQKSRDGDTVTIPFQFDKLSKYSFLGKYLYHYISGAGGTGKSAWVDLNYVINPALWCKEFGEEHDIRLKIVLRSMERTKEHRKAKWVCMWLYKQYGILIDVATLLGWGVKKNRITDELYEKIKEAYQWVESLEEYITIIDGVENPTGIYKQIIEDVQQRGTLYRFDGDVFVKERNGKKEKAHPNECPEATKYQPVYIPDDDKFIFIEVIDQVQALKRERGFQERENLDKTSEYMRISRDLYGIMAVVVNQLNRGIDDTYRKVKTELMPQESDLAGSSKMYYDCDMAGILFDPYKYNLNTLAGWNVKEMTGKYSINRFRSYHLLKNTHGPAHQIFGYRFMGENGLFKELPAPAETTSEIYRLARDPAHKLLLTRYMED